MLLTAIAFFWLVLFFVYNGAVTAVSLGFYVYYKDEPGLVKYVGLICAAYATLMLVLTFFMVIR